MESIVTATMLIVGLSVWHLRNRRLPGWRASDEGRFFICSGYPLLAIAMFWLVSAPSATAWEWALGNAWALASMVLFVKGFDALHSVTARHAELAQRMEMVEPSSSALPRRS